MREREALLQRALVAAVVGSVSPPPVAQVHATLCTELDLAPDSFSVRPFYPENFLLHFRSSEECRRVALRRSIRLGGTRLLVAPWSRHLHAEAGSMLFRVRLHLEGIPRHAWGEATAAAILGTSCHISSCDPVSVTAGDMAVFKLHAWTFDPSAIPKEKTLRIVEDEGLVVSLQGTGERYLDYTVYIHLTAVEDNAAPPVPYLSFAPSSDDTGHGGLPRSDDSDEGPPHRHFFCTTRGCRDGSPRPRPPASQGGGRDGGRQASRVRANLPATSAVRQERRPSRQSLLPYSRAAPASPPAASCGEAATALGDKIPRSKSKSAAQPRAQLLQMAASSKTNFLRWSWSHLLHPLLPHPPTKRWARRRVGLSHSATRLTRSIRRPPPWDLCCLRVVPWSSIRHLTPHEMIPFCCVGSWIAGSMAAPTIRCWRKLQDGWDPCPTISWWEWLPAGRGPSCRWRLTQCWTRPAW